MASIFTFETELARVSSPWLTPSDSPRPTTPTSQPKEQASSARLEDHGVTRLQAEPQQGPTEYKLHLLLRPRRNYSRSSTGSASSRPQQDGRKPGNPVTNESGHISAVLTPSRSRQHRLEQLTTQLLWRLQQSSPYHDFSTSDLVLPQLPEDTESLVEPLQPAKLLAGLEQSRGALYEIGVSDDGTFVGLTKDEMDESLRNLRVMAASLGCNVEIIRMVIVGDCEWQESSSSSSDSEISLANLEGPHTRNSTRSTVDSQTLRHQAQLWVAEALVSPNLGPRDKQSQGEPISESTSDMRYNAPNPVELEKKLSLDREAECEETEQLRITLTGPTNSGKSSLLGTLSTATLDNGRGKSRLSLLKHRHEIASGLTSSVAQELIGYKGSNVINYASGNVTSWTDIHFSSKSGRLVFISDSAGHWRYRRTIVRGLIGWAPSWIILCIAADENFSNSAGGTTASHDILGAAELGIDLGKAHLELCVKLERPLAVVITKLDLASKSSLRHTLSKILSIIKATGRVPYILPPDQAKNVDESDLNTIPQSNSFDPVRRLIEKIKAEDPTLIVPIVMTSAAKGTGIRSMHALLQSLPIPPTPTAQDLIGEALNPEQPASLFHIEDVFGLPASLETVASERSQDTGMVVAGHLKFGRFSVGDVVVAGPFLAEDGIASSPQAETRLSPNNLRNSHSHPSTAELPRTASRHGTSASTAKVEWLTAQIVSLRNLRLPVHTLEAGQVGTVGVVFDIASDKVSDGAFERTRSSPPRVRKGQVMAIPSRHMIDTGQTMKAASGFTASFEDSDISSLTPGSLVVVYVASIRAAARVLKLVPRPNKELGTATRGEELDVFGLNDQEDTEPEPLVFGMDGITDVTFELLTSREWVELGENILVMPGGGHGLYYGSERGEKGVAGLEGFAGRIIEVVD
ncbi:uncharacterized protein L3040_006468 [Drepanopeziza brunnea f. sp. 'multigermtubi']|uniref:uncharacterized protein n=1 Tax=Drepanopeziza brunnea f. sp. 'multigermtubi' TaxID=698441 RepID=UPI00239A2A1E|nr:hypothetical protein L3040_006468 [Drepanopeziza brunnea f. sp. 'multigermtubi']